jgi:hypothetical protein
MNRRQVSIIAGILIAVSCLAIIGGGAVVMGLGPTFDLLPLRPTNTPTSTAVEDNDTQYLNCIDPIIEDSLQTHNEIMDASDERDPENRFWLMCVAQPEWQERAVQLKRRHLSCPRPNDQRLHQARDYLGSALLELQYDTDAITKYCRGEDWHDTYWFQVSIEHAERFDQYMQWSLTELEAYNRQH